MTNIFFAASRELIPLNKAINAEELSAVIVDAAFHLHKDLVPAYSNQCMKAC